MATPPSNGDKDGGIFSHPDLKEALARLGFVRSDLREKCLADFQQDANKGVAAAVVRKRFEHYNIKRRQRMMLVKQELRVINNQANSPNRHGSPERDAKAAAEKEKTLSTAVLREQQQLEKIRARQQSELEQMIAYELRVAAMQEESERQIREQNAHASKLKAAQKARQRALDKARRAKDLARKKREEDEERERRALGNRIHRQMKKKAEEDDRKAARRRRQAREMQEERDRKAEAHRAQTEAIFEKQQKELREREKQMAERDRKMKKMMTRRRAEKSRLSKEKREDQQKRIDAARHTQEARLQQQRDDFLERQRQSRLRQREFDNERRRAKENAKQQAEQKAAEIHQAQEQMEKLEAERIQGILDREREIDARLSSLSKSKDRNHGFRDTDKTDNAAKRRKRIYEQMQQREEERINAQYDKMRKRELMAKAKADREAQEHAVKTEMLRLKELDRKEALLISQRKLRYRQEQTLKKINDNDRRVSQMKKKQRELCEMRKQAAREASKRKKEIVKSFDKMKTSKNFKLPPELGLTIPDKDKLLTSRSAGRPGSAMSRRSAGTKGKSSPKRGSPGGSSPKQTRGNRSRSEGKGKSKRPHTAGPYRAEYEDHPESKEEKDRPVSAKVEKKQRPVSANDGDAPSRSGVPAAGRKKGPAVRENVVVQQKPISRGGGYNSKGYGRKKKKKATRRGPRRSNNPRPLGHGDNLTREEASGVVEELRRKQNEQLLAVLEEEQGMEEGREMTMRRVENSLERQRLEKMYGIERAKASERIMRLTEEHEMVLAAKMAELGLVR